MREGKRCVFRPKATVGVRSDTTGTPDAFIKDKYEKKRVEKVLNLTRTVGVTLRAVMGQETSSLFLFVCFFRVLLAFARVE